MAKSCFETIQNDNKSLMHAANTATKLLIPLEPILSTGEGSMSLEIAADSLAMGANGDVRDVLCVRSQSNPPWTIGISCKHNHEALRHPRITKSKDFGMEWIGVPCSESFMFEMTPIIDQLNDNEGHHVLWRDIENKQDAYYVPILNAYLEELRRLCNRDPSVPGKLVSYFFGANDFYKVIMTILLYLEDTRNVKNNQ